MIEAVFVGNQNEVTVSGLTQWDRGRKLKIMLNDMPDKFEVHFATEGRSVAEVVEVATNGEYAVADIPNRILQKRENAIAYVYYADGDAGKTVKIIHLPIKPRPMPSDYLYEEGDILAYSRVIQLLETVKKGDDGKSAYQIWLDAGNIGDEAAFLASLEGATGAKGEPGATGPQGPAGKNGTPSEGTTKMMLRGYANQGTASLNWKITYSGGDSNNPITLVNRMSVQESNLNKRISGNNVEGVAYDGVCICDPIPVDLTNTCPVTFVGFATSMGSFASDDANYGLSKVALLDEDKTALGTWYISIGKRTITGMWKCPINEDDCVGDLKTIFEQQPTSGTLPDVADVAYVQFAPQIKETAITLDDLAGLEIIMPVV